jgi:hypothetical protein
MTEKRYGALDWRQLPGMVEARRLLDARKGPATEADRPRRESQRPRVMPGQLDLFNTDAAERGGERSETRE